MTKILITGATGKLGKLTIHHLINSKNVPVEQIVALVRDEEKAKDLSEQGVELRSGTYDDLDSLKNAFKNIDKLLIISSPQLDNMKRIQQQLNAVTAAKESNVKHIHLVSLADPEERIFDLEDVDMATEHMVLASHIPYTFLQNGVYLDEIKHDLNAAVKNGQLVSATKGEKFNYILRNDLALVNATVLSEDGHENKTYKLVNTELTDYPEVAKVLSEVIETNIPYIEKSQSEVIENLVDFGLNKEYAEPFVQSFQGAIAERKFSTTSTDITKIIGNQKSSLKESIFSLIEK